MSLKDELLQRGWLLEYPADLRKEQVSNLVSQSFGDLFYAEQDRAAVFRFRHAYQAVDDLATAALLATGYRVVFEGHQYLLQTLAWTIHASAELIAQLEQCRAKHGLPMAEQETAVSAQDAKAMMALAQDLRQTVRVWIRSAHPELVTDFI